MGERVPAHRVHKAIDRLLLGRAYPEVHRFMDRPALWVGSGHRRFRHDIPAVAWILLRTEDPKAAASALLHIIIDRADKRGKR